ncbi:5-(carboxyamino)imidazole ribonucleotide synthase [Tindallia magadiensis]|uniref:N5-carboxyaminoimidazole ribonucleotide synthase n=1 Tax=Tindallia magadiensis TaxID=69895 RepID=A0A1I3CCW6_9FIRM|nr:5-(carboxyamino)imidazole ribonucleotide synthase [Tindallia magadiensis]SFH72039.1 5-(carboxyamino)imidazole ribonucleotide synthase [Tindallia magadiensis]
MKRCDIGVVGGGQLGKMLLMEGHRMGLSFAVLDPSKTCPAKGMAHEFIHGRFFDEIKIQQLAEKSQRLTYEFEHIHAKMLMKLESKGCQVMPSPETLYMIQDKYQQNKELESHGLPVAPYQKIQQKQDLIEAADLFGYPFLLKSRFGGYDGKGNAKVDGPEALDASYDLLNGKERPLMAEKFIAFKMEISVIAARDSLGNIETFPVGQNIHRDNILDRSIVPAPLPPEVLHSADELAKKTLKHLKGAGIFCIEMFVGEDQSLWINEIAPRTHNSGHYSIEACNISQFGQQIRTIMGWPLIKPTLFKPAVMVNLLGDPVKSGNAKLVGIEKAMEIADVYPHWYGKTESRPGRKMGHVTILGDSSEEAAEKAEKIRKVLKVTV